MKMIMTNMNDENGKQFHEKQQKNTKNVHVIIKQQSFSELAPTDPSCNVLQTLDYGENIGDKKFSVEHVLR